MFLRDPDTEVLSAGIQVAYSCMTSGSSSHIFNFVVSVSRGRHFYRVGR